MKAKSKRKLDEVLQSAADRLFPAEIGEAKVYLDSRGCDGDNALHVFIWGNETENALFLIENGIDINAIGDMGETPLHAAIHKNNMAVIKALLNANTRTNIVSEFGKTALDLAMEKGINLQKAHDRSFAGTAIRYASDVPTVQTIAGEMNETLKASIAGQFKNTPLGFSRIKRNLGIIHFSDNETEIYLRKIILSTSPIDIETRGKNHYFKCIKYNAILTVNSKTFTVITAKQICKRKTIF